MAALTKRLVLALLALLPLSAAIAQPHSPKPDTTRIVAEITAE